MSYVSGPVTGFGDMPIFEILCQLSGIISYLPSVPADCILNLT